MGLGKSKPIAKVYELVVDEDTIKELRAGRKIPVTLSEDDNLLLYITMEKKQ